VPALADIVLTAANKDALVADCVKLTESRIASRGGLRGAAVKTGIAVLKKARPDILQRAVQALLPEFVTALDPLYQDFAAAPARGRRSDFSQFLQQHSDGAVEALLGVTDARVERVHNSAVKSVYARLRGGAEHEVGAALPEFGTLLTNYLQAAPT
jgi:hypothetical protein